MVESGALTVGYNRRTNRTDNPFRFEWDVATPAGTELWVNRTSGGSALIATAPTNTMTIFGASTTDHGWPGGPSVIGITSFELKMPNTPSNQGKTAKVNLVGPDNEWANQAWVLRSADN